MTTRTDVELMLARDYERACVQLARLRSWDHQIIIRDCAVSWNDGRATNGYQEMSSAVAALVLERIPDMINVAIRDAENNVESARSKLARQLNAPR